MKKNTEISERIKQIIDFVGVTNNEFAKKLGYNRTQSIYDIVNGKSKPSFDFFEKLINSEYSEYINVQNLISGNGEFFKTKSLKNVPKNIGDNLGDIIGDKPNVKKTYAIELAEKPTNTGIEANNLGNAGIPLIPIDAMAGFGTGAVQVMHYDTSKYVVPEFAELNVDFMIRVKGSSMVPKYNSGDLVACKKLVITDIFFQWNKVYVLDTEQGALIKRVKKGSRDNYILLISDNKNYDPFELHLSKIFAVALVVGVIRLE
ncbi:MAG: helix-turn-helix transcriptional regulator [Cloacibacterium caeni]